MSLKTNRTKKTKKPITRSSGQKRRTTQKAPHPSRTRGGDVIGSGGFGCVFRPALKCSRKKQRVHGMVSKLMTRRHTKREYSTIKGIKQRLRDIPQYTDYLLIDKVSTCTPAPLTDSDLSNFDKKCKVMKKHNDITSKNVNKNLSRLMVLELPDGGIGLQTYYHNMKEVSDFRHINQELIDLFTRAIIPMNSIGVYHGDIKESNILVNPHTHGVGLIDWGLSFYTKKRSGRIPKILKNKPFQYNLPFSVILFNKTFDTMYIACLEKYRDPSRGKVTEFVRNFTEAWMDKRGDGHMDTIDDIWRIVANDQDVDVVDTFIVPYLTDILMEYTHRKKFDKTSYFNEVFLPNLDIWGLLMAYSTILEHDTFHKQRYISDMYVRFLFSSSTTSIQRHDVEAALKNM